MFKDAIPGKIMLLLPGKSEYRQLGVKEVGPDLAEEVHLGAKCHSNRTPRRRPNLVVTVNQSSQYLTER